MHARPIGSRRPEGDEGEEGVEGVMRNSLVLAAAERFAARRSVAVRVGRTSPDRAPSSG